MPSCPTCAGRFDEATFCPRDGSRLVDDVGRLLGDRYRLIKKVGEGAMGEVFEAEHIHMNRRVAIKLLHRKLAAEPDAMRRLQREAQTTGGIGHPNIVESLDFGFTEDGQAYLVMEWLDGESLDARLARGPVDVDTALEIADQAASGLAEAHERGVIHRDLKPANVFLTQHRKGQLVVKVVDFGIAKLGAEQTQLTSTGVVIGTPIYMAPEQATGDRVDARTDLYALGVILYEMLAGTVPFSADTALALLHQHTTRMPVPPSTRAPERGITHEIDTLVMRCLAKQPEQRFATMHELRTAIAEARTVPANASAAPPAPPLPAADDDDEPLVPGGRRRRGLFIVAGVVAVVAAGVIAFAITRPGDGGETPTRDASLPIDASHADASGITVDATAVLVHAEGRGTQFAYRISIDPAKPEANQPFALVASFRDLSVPLQQALANGRLSARLTLQYFRDHSTAYDLIVAVDSSGVASFAVKLPNIAKHHGRVRLLVDGGEIDAAKFDLLR